jgi:negative regulator of sigma-B (phosphoserine phosphatase)
MDLVNHRAVDYYVEERPLEWVNGDMAFVRGEPGSLFVAIVDGAGHGPEAHAIAQESRSFLEKNADSDLPALMQGLHENLRGTRGGVAIIGKLEIERLQLRYVGIGNIVLRTFGVDTRREVTQQGVIGYQIRTPREKMLQLTRGDIVIMHTDGISSQFDVNDYPQILRDDAKTIAKALVKKFGKSDDDATCLALRIN